MCLACSSPMYFTPKSSTVNVNQMGLFSCLKRPGVWSTSVYLCSSILFWVICWLGCLILVVHTCHGWYHSIQTHSWFCLVSGIVGCCCVMCGACSVCPAFVAASYSTIVSDTGGWVWQRVQWCDISLFSPLVLLRLLYGCVIPHFVSGAFPDQEVLNSAGAFIVEDVGFWLVSCCFQFGVNAGECFHHAGIFPGFPVA